MNIPPEIPRVVPGQPIPRRALTRLAETVARTARTWVAGGLSIARVAGIPLWSNHAGRRVFVKLAGPTSPYSATLVVSRAGGMWEVVTPTVTLNHVYADNGEGGLDGKVVEVFRTGGDWWHFPYPRKGQTNPPPPSCTGSRTCATVIDDETGLGKPGVTVTVTFSNPAGSPPTVSFSGTTDSDGKFCADPPISGGVKGNPLYITAVTSLGATLSASPSYNAATDTCDATFHFCEVSLVAYAYDGDNADPGPDGGMAATLGFFGPGYPGYSIGAQVPDGWVAAAPTGPGIVNTGTKITFTAQSLTSPGSSVIGTIGYLPSYVLAQVGGYYGYGGYNCGGIPCGTTGYLPIPLFLQSKYVWNTGCDPGLYSPIPTCTPFHTDPPRKLVTPKRLYSTWTGPEPIFGGESGVTVTLDWDPTSWDGRYDHPLAGPPYSFEHDGGHVTAWTSDCSASGSYGGCYSASTHNCLSELAGFIPPYYDPVLLNKVYFGSRKILLEYNPTDNRRKPGISYQNTWDGFCEGGRAPLCHGSVAGGDAIYAQTFGYCPYDLGCPPYTTLPSPTGPRLSYPQSVGLDFPDPIAPTLFCNPVVNASGGITDPTVFAGCEWSWSVTVTE